MPESAYLTQLEVAIGAARSAEAIISKYFAGSFSVQTKADSSPVTEVDIHCEEAIRKDLGEAFPDYGFYGEETGTEGLDAEFLWLVDPIDGTKSFVRHSPFFSTQIALMHRGKLVMGVSNAPMLGEMACAALGAGATLNEQPLGTSACDDLANCFLSTGNLKTLAADAQRWPRFGALVRQVARTRGYGDFYHYHQLANAQADLVLESDVNILDIAALTVVVQQAGGIITDLEGQPIDLNTTSVLAAASPNLHQQAFELLCQ